MAKKIIQVYVNLPEKARVKCGAIIFDSEKNFHGFAYHPGYMAQGYPPLDPKNLNYRLEGNEKGIFKMDPRLKEATLHSVFKDAMPGAFGMQMLFRHFPDMRKMSDAEALYFLGSRQANGLHLQALDDMVRPMPARNFAELDVFRDEAHRVMSHQLSAMGDKFTPELRLSEGGARPKWRIKKDDGSEWVTKFNTKFDPYNAVRVEHAILETMRRAGIPTPDSEVHTLPSGEDVLLIRRYDIDNGQRAHKLSLATLAGVHGGGDYRDIIEAIRDFSCRPDEDMKVLFKSMLMDAGIHNMDNHLRNFEFILTAEGYRLTSQYDKMPEPALHGGHTSSFFMQPQADIMDNKFIMRAANEMGLFYNEAVAMRDDVVAAIRELPDFAREVGLSQNDRMKIKKAVGLSSKDLADTLDMQPGKEGLAAPASAMTR